VLENDPELPQIYVYDDDVLWSFPPVTVHMVFSGEGDRQLSLYMNAFNAMAVLLSGEFDGKRLYSAKIVWHCVNARNWDMSI